MLAFIMWHRPATGIAIEDYQTTLIRFHRLINSNKPPGLLNSMVFKVNKVPWLTSGAAAFEDWYILNSSGDMDILNDFAISGSRESIHDDIAVLVGDSVTGLYRFRFGKMDIKQLKKTYWFAKPGSANYAQYLERLQLVVNKSTSSLWTRQMGLSPAPEFCLVSEADGLDIDKQQIIIENTLIWPGVA